MQSKRTGGPRTEIGKSIAAQNSIKHGAYAKKTLLPGESAEQYEKFRENCIKVFKPDGELEENVLDIYVKATWRKIMFLNMQDKMISLCMTEIPFYKTTGCNYFEHPYRLKFKEELNLLNDDQFGELAHTYQLALDYQQSRSLKVEDFLLLQHLNPNLFFTVLNRVGAQNESDLAVMLGESPQAFNLAMEALDDMVKNLDGICWVVDHLDDIREEVEAVQVRAVHEFLTDLNLHRAARHLDMACRSAYEQLVELKGWRKKNKPPQGPSIILPNRF